METQLSIDDPPPKELSKQGIQQSEDEVHE